MARALDHPFTLGDVLAYGGCQLHAMRRDTPALKESVEELIQLASETSVVWSIKGALHRGEALAMLGQLEEGIAQMREGIATFQAMGSRTLLPGTLGSLAVAQAKAGQPQEGLATLAEALDLVAETEEHHWEAELYRLRGELLLVQDDEVQAERCFQKAVEVARRQRARSWEGAFVVWGKASRIAASSGGGEGDAPNQGRAKGKVDVRSGSSHRQAIGRCE